MDSQLAKLPVLFISIGHKIDHQHSINITVDSNVNKSSSITVKVVHILCSFVDNSAKVTEDNEITPQSNFVLIYEDGSCEWVPRYEMSVTQCPVDVTWFPFDKQECNVTFESWLLPDPFLNLVVDKDESIDLSGFLSPDDWHLTGKLACICWSNENAGQKCQQFEICH